VPENGEKLAAHCREMLERHHSYVREHFQDLPEIAEWTWGG